MKVVPFSQQPLPNNKIRIVFISDTHLCHSSLTIPPCHILVHCGDISFRGASASDLESINIYKSFNLWIQKAAPNAHKIVIAGNHDAYLDKIGTEKAQELLFNCVYLNNSSFTAHGIHFFGSPVSQETSRRNKAFQGDKFINTFLSSLPPKVDILVTHSNNIISDHRMKQLNAKIHAWGHFHNLYGVKHCSNQFISLCACVLNKRKPIIIDYDL